MKCSTLLVTRRPPQQQQQQQKKKQREKKRTLTGAASVAGRGERGVDGAPAGAWAQDKEEAEVAAATMTAAPQPSSSSMRIVSYFGHWLCHCGKESALWDKCVCGQASTSIASCRAAPCTRSLQHLADAGATPAPRPAPGNCSTWQMWAPRRRRSVTVASAGAG